MTDERRERVARAIAKADGGDGESPTLWLYLADAAIAAIDQPQQPSMVEQIAAVFRDFVCSDQHESGLVLACPEHEAEAALRTIAAEAVERVDETYTELVSRQKEYRVDRLFPALAAAAMGVTVDYLRELRGES